MKIVKMIFHFSYLNAKFCHCLFFNLGFLEIKDFVNYSICLFFL